MRALLTYFTSRGHFHAVTTHETSHSRIEDIAEEIAVLRRLGRLPGQRVNAARDHFVLVEAGGFRELVLPPRIDEDDDTPVHVPTGEMPPLLKPGDEKE